MLQMSRAALSDLASGIICILLSAQTIVLAHPICDAFRCLKLITLQQNLD
jgi:hypothetical protein